MMAMERIKINPAKVHNRPFCYTVKRLFDIVASACGLILLSPLFLFLIVLIRYKNNDATKDASLILTKSITI